MSECWKVGNTKCFQSFQCERTKGERGHTCPLSPHLNTERNVKRADSMTTDVYQTLSIIEGLAESILDECATLKYGGETNGETSTRTTPYGGFEGYKKTAEEKVTTKSTKEIPQAGVCCCEHKGKNCRFRKI